MDVSLWVAVLIAVFTAILGAAATTFPVTVRRFQINVKARENLVAELDILTALKASDGQFDVERQRLEENIRARLCRYLDVQEAQVRRKRMNASLGDDPRPRGPSAP